MGLLSAGVPNADSKFSRKGFDWPLFLSAFVLLFAGILTLYSESIQHDAGATFKKQLTSVVIGLVPFSIFAFIKVDFWRRIMPALYGVNVLLLVGVMVKGKTINGAQRWIQLGPIQLQPSELAKLLVILTLSSFLASRWEDIRKPSTFILSGLHVLLPALLIFKQPHLAATLVLVIIWLCCCLAGGVPLRYLGGTLLALVLMGGLATRIPGVLHGYQAERIMGLQNAGSDKNKIVGKKKNSDVNYQTERAAIAFGVGGVSGSGFLKGEQKQAHFVPYQSSDFVFTVVGEEGGLIGSALVLACFGLFFYRAWVVMIQAADPYYQMIVAGIIGTLVFHMTVNLCMVLRLIPVAGLWLPFFSAGGSALWLCMSCVGLLLNIRWQHRPLLF